MTSYQREHLEQLPDGDLERLLPRQRAESRSRWLARIRARDTAAEQDGLQPYQPLYGQTDPMPGTINRPAAVSRHRAINNAEKWRQFRETVLRPA